MGLPNINITFHTLAKALAAHGGKGTLAVILKDTTAGEYTLYSAADIPASLSDANKTYLSRAFLGNVTGPEKVLCKVLTSSAAISTGLSWAETQTFDYLVGPPDLGTSDAASVVTWVKAQRAAGRKSKAVLADSTADCEGIINFSASGLKDADGSIAAAAYCSRIAGLLAGTPFTQSATYVELPELTDATRLSRSDADTAVEAGKFIIWHDGRKFKTGRAVNSLTTLTGKSAAYQKIKIIEVMDLIREDITLTAEDQFIGKYPNSYDNRCLLLSAIKGYFESLATDGILGADPEVAIDPDANRTWLKTNGFDVSGMTEDELRQADTGSVVNLKATIRILDVIEDIELPILLNQ